MKCKLYAFKNARDCYLFIPEDKDISDVQDKIKNLPNHPEFRKEMEIKKRSYACLLKTNDIIKNIENKDYHLHLCTEAPYEHYCFVQCFYCGKTLYGYLLGRDAKKYGQRRRDKKLCLDCLKKNHPEVYKKYRKNKTQENK